MRKRREFLATLMSLVLCVSMMVSSIGNVTVAKADDNSFVSSVSATKDDITLTKSAAWVGESGFVADNDAAITTNGKPTAEITLNVNGKFNGQIEAASGKLDVILLMDTSNSMNETISGHDKTKIEEAKTNAEVFAKSLFEIKRQNAEMDLSVSIVTFNADINSYEDITEDNYQSIIWDEIKTARGTHLQGGLHEAAKIFDNKQDADKPHKQVMVLICDGRPSNSYKPVSYFSQYEPDNTSGKYFEVNGKYYQNNTRRSGYNYYYYFNRNRANPSVREVRVNQHDEDTYTQGGVTYTKIKSWYKSVTTTVTNITIDLNTGGTLTYNPVPLGFDYSQNATTNISEEPEYRNAAIMEAYALKQTGVNIFSIAFGLDSSDAVTMLENIATKGRIYKSASETDDTLAGIFDLIKKKIDVIAKGTIVTDVVPAYFDLAETTEELVAKGITVVVNADGTKTLTWNVGDELKDNTDYHVSFRVALNMDAQSAYNAGNSIQTNAPLAEGSEITAKFTCTLNGEDKEVGVTSPELNVITNAYEVIYEYETSDGNYVEIPEATEAGVAYTGTVIALDNVTLVSGIPSSSTQLRNQQYELGEVLVNGEATNPKAEALVVSAGADNKVVVRYDLKQYTLTFVNPYDDNKVLGSIKGDFGFSAVDTVEEKAARDAAKRKADPQFTYIFDTWVTQAQGNDKADISSIEKDTTVYAHFTSETNKYTVTFMDEDETLYQKTDVNFGDSVDKPANPSIGEDSLYEYSFEGWTLNEAAKDNHFDEPAGTYLLTEDAWENIEGDVTVYAVYTRTRREYTVSYYNVAADKSEELIYQDTGIQAGDTTTPPADPSRDTDADSHYDFSHWSLEKDGEPFDFSTSILEDTALFAVYDSKDNPIVTFMTADGYVTIDTLKVPYGTDVADTDRPAAPKLTDENGQFIYTFSHYAAEIGGSTEAPLKNITDDVTVYAVYNREDVYFNVEFYSEYDGKIGETQKVKYGDPAKAPELTEFTAEQVIKIDELTSNRRSFLKWDTDFSEVKSNLEVWAVYDDEFSYTVTYWNKEKGEEGNTENWSKTVVAGGSVTYGGTEPTKASTPEYSYTFTNAWTTEPEETEDNNLNNVQSNFDLYPIFEGTKRQYTVTFSDPEGDETNASLLAPQTVDYGTGVTEPTGLTRKSDFDNDYVFVGWELPAGLPEGCSLDNVLCDFTATSVYKPISKIYEIQFYDQKGTYLGNDTGVYGFNASVKGAEYQAAVAVPGEDAQYSSYVFDGWVMGKEGETGSDIAADITSVKPESTDKPMKVYASFVGGRVKSYTVSFVESSEFGKTLIKEVPNIPYGSSVAETDVPTISDTLHDTPEYDYTFIGWVEDGAWRNITGDVEVIADYKKEKQKYNVIFMPEYSECMADPTIAAIDTCTGIEYNQAATRPVKPSKPATASLKFDFAGWVYYDELGNPSTIDATDAMLNNVTQTFTVYAEYSEEKIVYKVEYMNDTYESGTATLLGTENVNGSDVNNHTVWGDDLSKPEQIPTKPSTISGDLRTDYFFANEWRAFGDNNDNPNGELGNCAAGDDIIVNQNMRMFPIFNTETYVVTPPVIITPDYTVKYVLVDNSGDSLGLSAPADAKYIKNTEVDLAAAPAIDTTMYAFSGWTTSDVSVIKTASREYFAMPDRTVTLTGIITKLDVIEIPDDGPEVPEGTPDDTPGDEPGTTPENEPGGIGDGDPDSNPEGDPAEEGLDSIEPIDVDPVEDEIIDVEEDETPQGDGDDILPKTGTAPVALFYIIGAAAIFLGMFIARKHDDAEQN